MSRLRLPAVALALLLSSNAWADLKTYDVDPQYSQEIFAALQDVLQGQGRVQQLPSGQILVSADAGTLAQVDQVLQALRARPAAAAPRVELQYWVVLGSRTPAANPPGTTPPNALNDVLAELKRVHGDLQFRVMGTTSLTTQSGQRGEIGGSPLHVDQTTFVQGDTLNARIEMMLTSTVPDGPPPNILEVGTSLRRGEFVVLGQSESAGAGGPSSPVFFIVHWPGPQGR
jgi:hypothetical protein